MTKTIHYSITVSAHSKKGYIDKPQIQRVLQHLKFAVPSLHFIHYSYECSGKYQQLHYHSIAKVNKDFRYKDYTSILGFSVKWKYLGKYIPIQCINYLYKDQQGTAPEQSQILYRNYTNNHNLFRSSSQVELNIS